MTDLILSLAGGGGRWGVVTLSAEEVTHVGAQVCVTDAEGRTLPSQLDLLEDGGGELVIDRGEAAGELRVGPGAANTVAQIGLDTLKDWQGQEALRIQTAAATYVYHTEAGGFASLIDPDGKDWISFRPWGGSDGIYRGIPNLGFPENVFHPGHRTCVTDAPRLGPLRATLRSRSKDDAWGARWDIWPDHAELTVEKFGHPYWLLYEGTPGGMLEEDKDFTLTSDGRRRPISERWDEVLPEPKWLAFGKEGLNRMLWLRSDAHEHRDRRDSCYAMEGNMTVFGFGRVGPEMTMNHAPARFTLGLAETGPEAALGEVAQAIAHASERATAFRAPLTRLPACAPRW